MNLTQNLNLSIVLSCQPTNFNAATLAGDFETNIAKIAGWGFGGVELAIRDPKLVDVDDLDRVITKHGLEVPAIGTGQAWGEEGLSFTSSDPLVRKQAVERIKSHIPLAKHFNAGIILGLIRGITPVDQNLTTSMSYLVEALQECTEEASKHNVRYVLEPINRYETDLINTVEDGLDLIRQVGADNFGLLLDTFHMNIEEKNIEESIRKCGPRIFHFHVADSNRWYPGAGHLDFNSILSVLAETGYQGYISGEFMPLPNADTSASQAIKFLKSL